MQTITRLLFGIRHDLDLRRYWWHRLFRVVFALLVPLIAGFTLLIVFSASPTPTVARVQILANLADFTLRTAGEPGSQEWRAGTLPQFLALPGRLGVVTESGWIRLLQAADLAEGGCWNPWDIPAGSGSSQPIDRADVIGDPASPAPSPRPQAPQTLAERIRARFPGAYDDLSNEDLEARVRAKYPGVYDDLPNAAQGAEFWALLVPLGRERQVSPAERKGVRSVRTASTPGNEPGTGNCVFPKALAIGTASSIVKWEPRWVDRWPMRLVWSSLFVVGFIAVVLNVYYRGLIYVVFGARSVVG
jgi:hypothetical protein